MIKLEVAKHNYTWITLLAMFRFRGFCVFIFVKSNLYQVCHQQRQFAEVRFMIKDVRDTPCIYIKRCHRSHLFSASNIFPSAIQHHFCFITILRA